LAIIEAFKSGLYLLKLAVNRGRSPADYVTMQRYIARSTVKALRERGVDLTQVSVLELGAGRGGYSAVLRRASKWLVATDLYHSPFLKETGVPFQTLDVLSPFPFRDHSFGLVYCSSLIEHVADPAKMLSEVWRVLEPGGYLFLSFPPFYSLAMVGGHTFKPFHFLGERIAVRIFNLCHDTAVRDYTSCYETWGWGLYPLMVDEVEAFIVDADFELVDIYTRMSPLNTAKLPGRLKDLLTWHVCYLAVKLFE
jgi:SAM-dependent methyltransferase